MKEELGSSSSKDLSRNKIILLLGASTQQIPAIEKAKEKDLYVITCDNVPSNPGHKFSDEYHFVSTTDKEGVLALAKEKNVDYVMSYASDPGAPVASYVSELLELPGNPFSAIQWLSEKHLFRKLLTDSNFLCPKFWTVSFDEFSALDSLDLVFPVIVKPVDSSGSKGVYKVESKGNLLQKAKEAVAFSRIKRIIIEEFIDSERGDFHGDGFVVDGELVFAYIGDHFYNPAINPFNPMGTSWPSEKEDDVVSKVKEQVQRVIQLSGFRSGPINIEARMNHKGDLFLMEIGPRSGGHFVPQAIQLASGFDMVDASLRVLMGQEVIIPDQRNRFSSYFALNSDREGILSEIIIDSSLDAFIAARHIYKKPGDRVKSFHSSNATLGILLFVFETRKDQERVIKS